MMDSRELDILKYLNQHPESSSKDVFDASIIDVSYSTIKRLLNKLPKEFIVKSGLGKSSRYSKSILFYVNSH